MISKARLVSSLLVVAISTCALAACGGSSEKAESPEKNKAWEAANAVKGDSSSVNNSADEKQSTTEHGGGEGVKTVALKGVSQMNISGGAALRIVQSGKESLSITTDKANLPFIKVATAGDVLAVHIPSTNKLPKPKAQIVLNVDLKQLTKLWAAGAVSVEAGALKAKTLELNLVGATSAQFKGLEVDSLKVTGEGSTSAELAGTVKDAMFSSSGASSLEAGRLVAKTCVVTGEGATSAAVNCGSLTKTLKGASSVSNAKD